MKLEEMFMGHCHESALRIGSVSELFEELFLAHMDGIVSEIVDTYLKDCLKKCLWAIAMGKYLKKFEEMFVGHCDALRWECFINIGNIFEDESDSDDEIVMGKYLEKCLWAIAMGVFQKRKKPMPPSHS